MPQLFVNLGRATLTSSIDASQTTLTVSSPVNLPTSLVAGEWFFITVFADSGRYGTNVETMKVTGISGSTYTVERGQDGTTGTTHAADELIEARFTADSIHESLIAVVRQERGQALPPRPQAQTVYWYSWDRPTIDASNPTDQWIETFNLEEPNIIVFPNLSVDSPWQESSANVTKTFAQPDRNGEEKATLVEITGTSSHHQWIDLPTKLTVGEQYTIKVWLNPDTTNGWTGNFQLAYYEVGTSVNSTNVTPVGGNGWQQFTFTFTAGDAPTDPSIRILGSSNGAVGDQILIGEVEVFNDTQAGVTTADYRPTPTIVAPANIATHTLPAVTWFNRPTPQGARVPVYFKAQPTRMTAADSMYYDFNVDPLAAGSWGETDTDLVASMHTPFGESCFLTNIEAGAYVGDTGLIRGTGWTSRNTAKNRAFLSYYVRFKDNFDWVKGGKIPGLGGGTFPSGGDDPAAGGGGFTARMMWRADGQIEVYLYCLNDEAASDGASLGRGAYIFASNVWYKIQQEVKLNTIDGTDIYDDGLIRLWVNERPVFEQTGIIFRDNSAVTIDGVMATIFFGGGDTSWRSTQDETIEHGGYTLYSTE